MGLDKKCDQRSKHRKFDLLRNTGRTETFNFRFLSQCIIGEKPAQSFFSQLEINKGIHEPTVGN